jgi:hypothetical protein
MGASIVGLIGRERCAGGLPLSTILTGARAQGRDALCSGGCAIFGDRAGLRCRKRKSYHFPPRRRHAPTEKPTARFPKQPDPGRTHHGQTFEGLVTPPQAPAVHLPRAGHRRGDRRRQPKGLRLAGRCWPPRQHVIFRPRSLLGEENNEPARLGRRGGQGNRGRQGRGGEGSCRGARHDPGQSEARREDCYRWLRQLRDGASGGTAGAQS